MKIAIAQLNPTIGDLVGNAQQILQAAQRATDRQIQLLLTPELSLCGYPPRDLLLNPSFVAATQATLQQLAQDLPPDLSVLVGTVEPNLQAQQTGGKPLFNSMALLQGGNIQQRFHKRLLPTYDVFDEDRYFAAGQVPNCFELDGLNIGVTICEDLWNDEAFWGQRRYLHNPIADLAAIGVDLTINLSASPYTVGKQKVREAMLGHLARRYDQPIIYANQVGGNDDLIFDGNSVAVNRHGQVVGRAAAFGTDWLELTFDPHLGDLLPSAIAPAPVHETAEIWQALVLGVRDYARKCGFSKIVLGLSGGIDSALVAAIAVAALGPDRVLGVLMPSPYSSEHSVQDALALVKNLGIAYEILPIADLMQAFDRTLAPVFGDRQPDITEENLQSRIRGTLLMAIANKLGHLLLSTGNKSEMAVGYCTLYGDMDGGLAAIADVPKMQVYALCQWLNQGGWEAALGPGQAVIPENILTKAPSAELRPDQVDADSLPPYPILDDILARLLEEHQSLEEIVAAGYDAALVQKVATLVDRSEFKRKQAPPGLKITDRAFGTGWRMPIAKRWQWYSHTYRSPSLPKD